MANGGNQTLALLGLIETLRQTGVTAYKGHVPDCPTNMGSVELVLGSAPAPAVETDKPAPPPVDLQPKRGLDGLTAEEQVELYGKVIDKEL